MDNVIGKNENIELNSQQTSLQKYFIRSGTVVVEKAFCNASITIIYMSHYTTLIIC